MSSRDVWAVDSLHAFAKTHTQANTNNPRKEVILQQPNEIHWNEMILGFQWGGRQNKGQFKMVSIHNKINFHVNHSAHCQYRPFRKDGAWSRIREPFNHEMKEVILTKSIVKLGTQTNFRIKTVINVLDCFWDAYRIILAYKSTCIVILRFSIMNASKFFKKVSFAIPQWKKKVKGVCVRQEGVCV